MSGPGTPAPIAQGNLAQTPFPHVLGSLFRKKFTGTLVVWPDDGGKGQDRLGFRDGVPVAARPRPPTESVKALLNSFMARSGGSFALYEVDVIGEHPERINETVDPIAFLATTLRTRPTSAAIMDGALSRFVGQVRLSRTAALNRLGLDRRDLGFIETMRAGPAPVGELIQSWVDRDAARRILYVLSLAGWVEAYDPSAHEQERRRRVSSGASAAHVSGRPGAGAAGASDASGLGGSGSPSARARRRSHAPGDPDPPPSMPSGLNAEASARWAEVSDKATAIENQTYFEMLGIERSAGSAKVQAAYLELVKRWHPDRLPRELSSLRPWADRIFHHMTTAKNVLSDEKERKKYLETVAEGGGTPAGDRRLAAIVQAAMDFQKVEILVRRKSWDEARTLLDDILATDPDQPDYLAAMALIELERTKDPVIPPLIDLVDRALAQGDRHERAHYTKGLLLERAGRMQEAMPHFRRAAEINPKNLDAVRRVRLATSRAGRASNHPAGDGLLSRLFGKKKGD